MIFEAYSTHKPAYGDAEMQLIFDTVRDHYQLVLVGWHSQRRMYGCLLQVDITHDQIWIQYDGTEEGIATILVELGVPKTDIVLAFHSPYKRRFTEFGVGDEYLDSNLTGR